MRVYRYLLCCLPFLVANGSYALPCCALAQPSDRDAAQPAVAPEFMVPQTTDELELRAYIQGMLRWPARGDSKEEVLADRCNARTAAANAAEKLYKVTRETDPRGFTANWAMQYHSKALKELEQLGDKTARTRRQRFAELVAQDQREQVATQGERLLLELKMEFPLDADQATVRRLALELKERFGQVEIDLSNSSFLNKVLRHFELAGKQSGDYDAAIDLYQYFGKRAGSVSGPRWTGSARRLRLPGNTLEIPVRLLDVKELDWSRYEGKVVLVYFIGYSDSQLIRAQYEKYHDLGFDVFGIYRYSIRERFDKYVEEQQPPWKVVFSTVPGWQGPHCPLAVYYGVHPSVAFLVNREGKVVSLYAQGAELTSLLEELLGSSAP